MRHAVGARMQWPCRDTNCVAEEKKCAAGAWMQGTCRDEMRNATTLEVAVQETALELEET